ncbi:MAG TPA: ABC transporter permease, partial [Gemmatimonadaceae bacterium]|nr:ABC transporter permease [Gemmatimonadaceae bacterium]
MLRSIAAAAGWISREAGFRFLARRRAACAAAIVAMALALGANTAVFSVTRTFLLASIGVPDATRVFLVAPLRDMPGRGAVTFNDAYPNYQMMRSMPHPFAAMTTVLQGVSSWEDHDETRPLQSARVTASFFPTMQVFPALGRAFGEDAEGPSPANVVVISHAVWQSGFAGDSAVIGKTMRIDGALCTVIGVMPAGFGQPAPTDIWMPFDIPPRLRANITGARTLGTYARLGSDKPPALAAAAADAFTAAALKANSVDNKDFRYSAQSMRSFLLNGADKTVLLVQAGAAVLLLLAVLNLASLLVAWGYDRRQEIAVRRALGASGPRLMRQLLTETAVLAFASTALAMIFAAWT